MQGKSFLIDTSRCIGCRACQIACKSWNRNGAVLPANRGAHQNPPDLDAETFKLVRFSESTNEGKPVWRFFADQCRHCLEPDCVDAVEGYVAGGALRDTATGAVIFTEMSRKARFQDVRNVCPYDIPRKAPDGRIVKCTMCLERVKRAQRPACVEACPTGAMAFGQRKEILSLGEARVKALGSSWPKARLVDAEYVRVIFLLLDAPSRYHPQAETGGGAGMTRRAALRRMTRFSS